MKTGAYVLVSLFGTCLCAAMPAPAAESTLLRLFLKDGSSLVSYGEPSVVGDRVVFSMPVGAPQPADRGGEPPLQLVTIPSERVDWTHTNTYAESARASRYYATRAQQDYEQLSSDVAKALNDISQTTDPLTRIAIVENARRMLTEWPSHHYFFNQKEVLQLVAFLDEAIANLQASTGVGRFNFNLVASAAAGTAPALEPLLPPPTLKETIEQTLLAAGLADSPYERSSLLSIALEALRRDDGTLPPEWAASTAAALRSELADAVQVERDYQLLTQKLTRSAEDLARAADVRGIERLLEVIRERDAALGGRRPDMIEALKTSVRQQLDAARQLRLELDHWNARQAAYRRYNAALAATFQRFDQLKAPLDDIQALAGSSPATLAAVDRLTTEIIDAMSRITPPVELEATHGLLVSAAQLADSAGKIRAEAVRTASIDRAWDASSAAAGSLMLISRAQAEITMRLQPPRLPQ